MSSRLLVLSIAAALAGCVPDGPDAGANNDPTNNVETNNTVANTTSNNATSGNGSNNETTASGSNNTTNGTNNATSGNGSNNSTSVSNNTTGTNNSNNMTGGTNNSNNMTGGTNNSNNMTGGTNNSNNMTGGDPCVDDDGDGRGANCMDGGDCDDADANVWDSCATCLDSDGDGWHGVCDVYDGINGPDCDDANENVWMSCAACSDTDNDGYFQGCDAYVSVDEDCDDDNDNVWASCADCEDSDGDGYWAGCDAYASVAEDCDDANDNAWMSCGSCVDSDGDGYWVGCDAYASVGEDCDDSMTSVNPGASEVPGNGIDDDCDTSTADAVCVYDPVPATDPEPGIMAGVTAAHNEWRWRVGVPPLVWNGALAASATAYAQQCIWQHDANRGPDAGFTYVGENLYASSQGPSNARMLDAVFQWAVERYDFDYGFTTGQTTGGQVGHYTQIVWDSTTDVGCGYADCPSIQGISFGGTVVVCRYGPSGNWLNEMPYQYEVGACFDMDNDDVWQMDDPDDTDRDL